jgi:hypothetical protein
VTETAAGGKALSVEGLEWESRRLEARFALGRASHPISIEASEDLCGESDALVALGLLPAMKLGVPLRVPGEVSPRLLGSTEQIQEIFRLWHEDARIVAVEARPRSEVKPTGGGIGAFFSGGVDSFFTLLERREEITDLIFVHGFDIPLSGKDGLRRRASEMARNVSETLGKRLIEVRADIRSFSDSYVSFLDHNGAALAAIALLFQQRFRTVLIPSTQSYAHLYPSGSHPLLDPLWSTERTEVLNDGAGTMRPEKVASIAADDLAMSWLRVCLQNPDGAYNCGRCEKCLRTLVNLRAVGAEGRCRTLPDRLDLREVSYVALIERRQGIAAREDLRESLRVVDAKGADPELARALRMVLRADQLRTALESSLFGPIRRFAPPWARRTLHVVRRQVVAPVGRLWNRLISGLDRG